MNNDLINREALKKALKSGCDICHDKNTNWCEHCCPLNDFEDLIDDAPTVTADNYAMGYQDGVRKVLSEKPQGEWVPVSERLPEEKTNPYTLDFEYVLCSTIWDDVRPYKYGKSKGDDKAHFWYGGRIMDEAVIAWQPLPEPYKEEDEENGERRENEQRSNQP